jgi:hypothetical protein
MSAGRFKGDSHVATHGTADPLAHLEPSGVSLLTVWSGSVWEKVALPGRIRLGYVVAYLPCKKESAS